MKKTIKLITATALMLCLIFVCSADVNAQQSSLRQTEITKVKIGTGSCTSKIVLTPKQAEKVYLGRVSRPVQNTVGKNTVGNTSLVNVNGRMIFPGTKHSKTVRPKGTPISGGK